MRSFHSQLMKRIKQMAIVQTALSDQSTGQRFTMFASEWETRYIDRMICIWPPRCGRQKSLALAPGKCLLTHADELNSKP